MKPSPHTFRGPYTIPLNPGERYYGHHRIESDGTSLYAAISVLLPIGGAETRLIKLAPLPDE